MSELDKKKLTTPAKAGDQGKHFDFSHTESIFSTKTSST